MRFSTRKKGIERGFCLPPKKKKMKKCDCEAEEREVVAWGFCR